MANAFPNAFAVLFSLKKLARMPRDAYNERMPTVSLSLGKHSYDVHVRNGALDAVGYLAARARLEGKAALITDSNVYPLYGERAKRSLEDAHYSVSVHVVPAGEASKSLEQVGKLVEEMVQAGHDRTSFVVALGGGVVGDLAGFVASIYYRGIPFVQVPTSVMAQVDSSVGGKTAVNTASGKNLIGTFHQPVFVVADPITLLSLPERVLREGMAEMVKHAAIRRPKMLVELRHLADELQIGFSLSSIEKLPDLIAENLEIKARIVETDERETTGTRAFLNFGHTLGHGIEASVPYGSLLHGEVVSLGIRAALFLSQRMEELPTRDATEILNTLAALQLPLQLPKDIRSEEVLRHTCTDKKFRGGQIHFVLLKKVGEPLLSTAVSKQDLQDAISHLMTPVILRNSHAR